MGAARKLDTSGRKNQKRFSNLPSVRPQDQSWLSVVRLGNTFRISVTENRTQNWRNGEIRVTGPGVTTRIVQVRQEPSTRLTIFNNQISEEFDVTYGNSQIPIVRVQSNSRWRLERSHNWILLDEIRQPDHTNDGSFRITIQPNPGITVRNGYVSVIAGGITRRIYISQAARPHLSISQSTWSASRLANGVMFTVTSNRNWTMEISDDWLWVNMDQDATFNGTRRFWVNAYRNPDPEVRVGTITFSSDGLPDRVLTVTQAWTNRLELSGEFWIPSSFANATDEIWVNSNVNWTATVCELGRGWLSFTRTGTSAIRLAVRDNPTTAVRRGIITVTAPNADPRIITVTQLWRPPAPSAPTRLRFSNITYNSATLSWDAPATGQVTGYRVYWLYRDNLDYLASTSATSMNFSGLSSNAEYQFVVVATGPGGRSEGSDVATLRTELAPTIVVPPVTGGGDCRQMSQRIQAVMEWEQFNQARWNAADSDGRQEILLEFYRIIIPMFDEYFILPRLGRPTEPLIIFEPLQPGENGRHLRATGSIMISTRLLDGNTDEELRNNRIYAFSYVIHEARHEFQWQASRTDRRQYFDVRTSTRDQWHHNLNNLVSPFIPNTTIITAQTQAEYLAQPIEWDAWNFKGPIFAERLREMIELSSVQVRPEYEGSWPWYE